MERESVRSLSPPIFSEPLRTTDLDDDREDEDDKGEEEDKLDGAFNIFAFTAMDWSFTLK